METKYRWQIAKILYYIALCALLFAISTFVTCGDLSYRAGVTGLVGALVTMLAVQIDPWDGEKQ